MMKSHKSKTGWIVLAASIVVIGLAWLFWSQQHSLRNGTGGNANGGVADGAGSSATGACSTAAQADGSCSAAAGANGTNGANAANGSKSGVSAQSAASTLTGASAQKAGVRGTGRGAPGTSDADGNGAGVRVIKEGSSIPKVQDEDGMDADYEGATKFFDENAEK